MDATQTLTSSASDAIVISATKAADNAQVGTITLVPGQDIIPEQQVILDDTETGVTYIPKGNGKSPLVFGQMPKKNNTSHSQKNVSSSKGPTSSRQAPTSATRGSSHTPRDKGKKA